MSVRFSRSLTALAALVSMITLGGMTLAPSVAGAAVPAQQWITGATGTNAAGGTVTFGTSGESATVSGFSPSSVICNPTKALEATNTDILSFAATSFYVPAIPADAEGVSECKSGAATSATQTVLLNKPLLSPYLYENNLDASYLDISALAPGGAVTLSTVTKTSWLNLEDSTGVVADPGTRLASQAASGGNGNCVHPQSPSYPTCGTFAMAEDGGQVTGFTMTSTGKGGSSSDGWFWSMSFPVASVTPTFADPIIAPGEVTQLTLSLTNPSATDLTPLDFTNALPAGVTIADGTETDNGSCGSPTVTDSSGLSLGSGSDGVQATGITLPAGATCTITVDVTSSTIGSYTDDSTLTSSTIGNVVPDGSDTLEIAAAVGAPLMAPIAGTGAAGLFGVFGIVLYRRRRRLA